MNRLKYILIVLSSCLAFASCNRSTLQEDMKGYLSVSLQRDDSVQMKAVAAASPDQLFSLDIYKGEDLVQTVADYRDLETSPLELVADRYRIVAYSGEQQAAAWDTPFYKGEADIRLRPDVVNNAEIICAIENVAVSVAFDDTFKEVIADYSVTVDNGQSSLVFSSAGGTLDKMAYFSVTGNINWRLEFTNKNGKKYSSTGTYSEVTARQHYKLQFSVSNRDEVLDGAAGIKIVVDDSVNPVKEFVATVILGDKQDLKILTNEGFSIDQVITVPAGDESLKSFIAIAKAGISNLIIRQRADSGNLSEYSMWYDLVEASPSQISKMNAAGILASAVDYGQQEATIDITRYVGSLAMGEYVLEVVVYDLYGQKVEKSVHFNVLSGVDAEAYSVESGATTAKIIARWFTEPRPTGLGLEYRTVGTDKWTTVNASSISFDSAGKRFSAMLSGLDALTEYEFRPYSENDRNLTSRKFTTSNTVEAESVAPWGKFSVVRGKWFDPTRPANICFEYREYGTTGWIKADVSTIEYFDASKSFVGEIRGLEPEVTYEFRANSDGAVEDRLDYLPFTTGKTSTVYNLNFDEEHTEGKVWYPFSGSANTSPGDMSNFLEYPTHLWDSANEGAATFIGSSTTAASGADAIQGKAVRMESKWAVIAFAAGNLYTGDFGKINGKGAILNWGIEFDSKPLALKGYYKYTPKTIDRTGDDMSAYKGQMDKMQIQICLTTLEKPFTVNTLDKQFVDFNADYVMAYGKIESDVNTNNAYREFTIPLEYRTENLGKTPTIIIISACASYLGDYFTGGVGSTLFVDEFSLEYSPENLTAAEREKVNYR